MFERSGEHPLEPVLIDDCHSQSLRLIKFGPRRVARYNIIRLLTNRRIHSAAPCFNQRACLIASKAHQRSCQHKLLARKALVNLRTGFTLSLRPDSCCTQPITKRTVPFIVKPVAHALSDRESNFGNRIQLFHRSFHQLLERAELVREDARRSLTDVPNSQRVNKVRKISRLTRFDLRQQVRSRLLCHARKTRDLIERQRIEIANVLYKIRCYELFGEDVAQSLDAHCTSRGEVNQATH